MLPSADELQSARATTSAGFNNRSHRLNWDSSPTRACEASNWPPNVSWQQEERVTFRFTVNGMEISFGPSLVRYDTGLRYVNRRVKKHLYIYPEAEILHFIITPRLSLSEHSFEEDVLGFSLTKTGHVVHTTAMYPSSMQINKALACSLALMASLQHLAELHSPLCAFFIPYARATGCRMSFGWFIWHRRGGITLWFHKGYVMLVSC